MSDQPRVFIVEDHELTRAGARHFLGDRYAVVGEASSVADAAQLKKTLKTLEDKMFSHARDLEFEEAAAVRDEIERLKQHFFME